MSNTKIRNKHGWGAPENGSLQAAEVAVDLNGKNLYSTATDGGSVFKIGEDDYSAIDHNHDYEYAPLAHDHDGIYAEVGHDHDTEYSNIAHKHKLDDLSDVFAARANRDDILRFNGSIWETEAFQLIESVLTFKGGYDLTTTAPFWPENGDIYVANKEGVIDNSWTGLGGQNVNVGNFVGWAEENARWYLLGDLSNAAVTDVKAGTGISVNDSKPHEPVVSVDRVELNTWYAPIADYVSKTTAGNQVIASGLETPGNMKALHFIGDGSLLTNLPIKEGPRGPRGRRESRESRESPGKMEAMQPHQFKVLTAKPGP